MRIRYNAPFTLTFSLACAAVLAANQYLYPNLIHDWFTVGGQGSFHANDGMSYLRLFSYVLGHSGWDHFYGNLMTLILIGPILEEKYQTPTLVIMVLITALVTGIINVLFFQTALLGASGVIFLMILLVSFANAKAGEIPLTFVAVLALYVGQQVFDAFKNDHISQFAHIIGGLCGSVFGFITLRLQEPPKPRIEQV
jgi:membrane associated rhomboid family serine protease